MREEAIDLDALVQDLVGPAPSDEAEAPRWQQSHDDQRAAIVELMDWVRREVLGEAA